MAFLYNLDEWPYNIKAAGRFLQPFSDEEHFWERLWLRTTHLERQSMKRRQEEQGACPSAENKYTRLDPDTRLPFPSFEKCSSFAFQSFSALYVLNKCLSPCHLINWWWHPIPKLGQKWKQLGMLFHTNPQKHDSSDLKKILSAFGPRETSTLVAEIACSGSVLTSTWVITLFCQNWERKETHHFQ